VLDSLVSTVTNVSLEHTEWLGDTVEDIAENKAGILNESTVLVTASNDPRVVSTLSRIAEQKNSSMLRVGKDIEIIPETKSLQGQQFTVNTPTQTISHLTIPLIGDHQLRNAACAIAAVEAVQNKGFRIPAKGFHMGLADVVWPGRFEIVEKNPLIVLDGAKDPYAVTALVETVKQYLPGKHIYTILGISSDKDHESMIQSLNEITQEFILTEHRVRSRTAAAINLEKIARKTGKPTSIITPVEEAVNEARKQAAPDDVILVTGSVFLIGEAREIWYPA
jgi:dihydrofolate synthase/folylpolyglutamate synthase